MCRHFACLIMGALAAGARAQRPEVNCTYTAPSGDYYDIRPLARLPDPFPNDHIIPIDGSTTGEAIHWNSCLGVARRGEIPGFQCGPADAACLHDPIGDPERWYSLGKLDTVDFLETRPGFLVARYTGGSMGATGPREITMEIECDRDAELPRFDVRHETGARTYLLIVYSVHGCVKEAPPPPPPTPSPGNSTCQYVGPSGNRYNIAELVNATSDWMFTDTAGDYIYHWNSCSGLKDDILPAVGSGQDCSAGPNGTPLCGCRAAADAGCQAYQEPGDYGPYALGTLDSAEYRETLASDGSTQLSVLYRNGAESATHPEWGPRSLRVDFQCFPEVDEPLFRMVSPTAPDMEYRVTVVSKFGCPVRDDQSCVLQDAAGDTEYDLGPLVGTTFVANSTETPFPYDYYIGVCAPIRDDLCLAANGDNSGDAASCQIIMNPDPGSDPSTYTFNNGVAKNRTILPIPDPVGGVEGVRIVYNDGELCDAPGAPRIPRRTILDAYCTPDIEPPLLKYIAESPPCTYTFALETRHACRLSGTTVHAGAHPL